jgi:hypothetical protein
VATVFSFAPATTRTVTAFVVAGATMGAGAATTRGWTAGFVRLTGPSRFARLAVSTWMPSAAVSIVAVGSSAGGAARATGSGAGCSTAAGSSTAASLSGSSAGSRGVASTGPSSDSGTTAVGSSSTGAAPPSVHPVVVSSISAIGSGLATTSAEPSTSWSGPAATAAAGAPTPENTSRPVARAACVLRDTISSPSSEPASRSRRQTGQLGWNGSPEWCS